jgi:hypothetical protein
MNSNRRIILSPVRWLLGLVICGSVLGADKEIVTYGVPGEGKIRVEVAGGYNHPGIYRLLNGTKLTELVERAHLKIERRGEFNTDPFVTVTRKDRAEQHRFQPPLNASGKASAFILQDGDRVTTALIDF